MTCEAADPGRTKNDRPCTGEKLAATSQQKSCKKAQLEKNAANKGSGISRKYAGSTK
jgi:hypothetical protein